jgi:DNA ligase-1
VYNRTYQKLLVDKGVKVSIITKPMLASTLKNWDALDFNKKYYATPKIDGIRALMIDGHLVSRTFKPIPNHYIRKTLEKFLPEGADGEIVSGNFQETTSAVMTEEGEPNFIYYIFDYVCFGLSEPYTERMNHAQRIYQHNTSPYIQLLMPTLIIDMEQMEWYERDCLNKGFEGVILRTNSSYKCGRATEKSQSMLKIKRFLDSEAVILDFGEKMHNTNEAKKDNFSRTKRSTEKSGMVSAGTLGYLSVRDIKTGIEFEIGSGFNDKQRDEMWEGRNSLIGKLIKYKYFAVGVKEKPRFPVFLGFRDKEDI